MGWLDRLFTRHDHHACFDPVPEREVPRLLKVCAQLSETERQVQECMGLEVRPSLTLVDEEMGRIVSPQERETLERRARTS